MTINTSHLMTPQRRIEILTDMAVNDPSESVRELAQANLWEAIRGTCEPESLSAAGREYLTAPELAYETGASLADAERAIERRDARHAARADALTYSRHYDRAAQCACDACTRHLS